MPPSRARANGRCKANGHEDGAALAVGCRHGHHKRTLTGTLGEAEISLPRARHQE
jgi:hypothetical protein